MADSSQTRSGVSAFVQKKSATRVVDILTEKMPFFDFLLAQGGSSKKRSAWGIGRPDGSGLMLAAAGSQTAARREKIMAERQLFLNQKITKRSTSDVKMMDDYDSKPVVPNAATTNATLGRYKQARFKFARFSMPYKVWHSEVRNAKPGAGSSEAQLADAIGGVYDAEVKDATSVLCEKMNNQLFGVNGENGYPTDEDAANWDSIYSLKKAIDSSNTYGGLDRSLTANAKWRGNHVTTAVTYSFQDAINYFNYGTPRMAALGLGVNLILVGGALMIKAKEEADAKGYEMFSNGVPEFAEYGFKKETVRIYSGGRAVYVVYDPSIPDVQRGDTYNEAAFLDTSTWTVAIPPDGNFKVKGPNDQSKIEGGDEADTGTVETELLLACEVPAGNGYFDRWT